jgi:NAD(P)-dependent dehydrogenase (short-subunit alcohol dehydrogenase family)
MCLAMDASPEELHKTFQVGVFGPIYLIQAALPHMSQGGRIVNIGSVASKIGFWKAPLYTASKAAMDALTFAMSREVRSLIVVELHTMLTTKSQLGREGKGITINSVLPGPVLTDSLPPGLPLADETKDYLVSETRADGRPGTVEEIADAVLLLASDKSRWITGQCISVSGGITGG